MNCDLPVYAHCAALAVLNSDLPGYSKVQTVRSPISALRSAAAGQLSFEVWRDSSRTWEPMVPKDAFAVYPGMFLLIRRAGISPMRPGLVDSLVQRLRGLPEIGEEDTPRACLIDPHRLDIVDEGSPFRVYMAGYLEEHSATA